MLATIKSVKLTAYPKRKKKEEKCDASLTYTDEQLNGLSNELLKDELRQHNENQKGVKIEMIQRLRVHYALFPDR